MQEKINCNLVLLLYTFFSFLSIPTDLEPQRGRKSKQMEKLTLLTSIPHKIFLKSILT